MTKGELRERLIALYHGETARARRFRFGLLAFDIVTVGFFIVSSMVDPELWWQPLDFALAAVLAVDYAARLVIANRPARFVVRPTALADAVVIFSLLAPVLTDNFAFLRVARMLRLLRSYHVLRELRGRYPWFRANEEVINASVNLMVFVFLVTAVVYVVEGHVNPQINNYFDALYFTATTLTTTGFGDIVMQDTAGRALAVVIMFIGVGLFLRLVQALFRPTKIAYTCPDCGLRRHEPDAIHCKHCGRVINIPSEGEPF